MLAYSLSASCEPPTRKKGSTCTQSGLRHCFEEYLSVHGMKGRGCWTADHRWHLLGNAEDMSSLKKPETIPSARGALQEWTWEDKQVKLW